MGTILKPPQAAEFLTISLGTLYAWVEQGKVPYIRLGTKALRFDSEELREFIDRQRVEAR